MNDELIISFNFNFDIRINDTFRVMIYFPIFSNF